VFGRDFSVSRQLDQQVHFFVRVRTRHFGV